MRRSKRIVSLLLAIVLLGGLLPSGGQSWKAKAASGEIVYQFNRFNGDDWVGSAETLEDAPWKVGDISQARNTTVSIAEGGGLFFGNDNYRFQDGVGIEWFQVRIEVPVAGTYALSAETIGGRYYAPATVYLREGETQPLQSPDYIIGEIPANGEEGATYTTRIGEVTLKAGVYTVAFLPTRHKGYYFHVKNLKLTPPPLPRYTYDFNRLDGDNWLGSAETPDDAPWKVGDISQARNTTVSIAEGGGLFFGNENYRFQDGVGIEWFQVRLQVPRAGTYTLSTENIGGRYYAPATVYLREGETQPLQSADYIIGEIPANGEEGAVYTTEVGEVTLEAGVYTVAFLPTRHKGYFFHVKNLRLTPPGWNESGGESALDTLELQPQDTTAYIGEEGVLMRANGYNSNGDVLDMTGAQIEWTSQNPEIAQVDGHGLVTALTEGSAVIQAQATLGEISLTAQATVVAAQRPEGEPKPVVLDFAQCSAQGHDANIEHATLDTCGWQWNTLRSDSRENFEDLSIKPDGLEADFVGVATVSGRNFALDVEIPTSGYYKLEITYPVRGDANYGGWHRTYIAHQDGLGGWIQKRDSGNREQYLTGATVDLGNEFYNAGVHTLWFQLTTQSAFQAERIRLVPVNTVLPGDLTLATDSISAMNINTDQVSALKLHWKSGGSIRSDRMDYRIGIADPSIASASIEMTNDASGKILRINAKSPGDTKIQIEAMAFGNAVAAEELTLHVKEPVVQSAQINSPMRMISLDSEGMQLSVKGVDLEGEPIGIPSEMVIWKSLTPEIAQLSAEGWLTPVAAGEAVIEAQVDAFGYRQTLQISISVRTGKMKQSYYTEEKLAAARKNIQNYSWAKEIKDAAVAKAEKFVDLDEKLWNFVTSQDLPRSFKVGYWNGPKSDVCRYCKVDMTVEFGTYSWIVDALNNPWKIRCPNCRRSFPSNDFGSFYELGLDENGNWNYDKAKQKNAELVAAGQDGYLKNILYPEMEGELLADGTPSAPNWGVDDGWGYRSGKKVSINGQEYDDPDSYISYYNHWAIWYGANSVVSTALDSLMEAYNYTGEAKYGRVGAILMDRVADVYPDMTHKVYTPVFFLSPYGKITDRIWGTGMAKRFALAYDSFYPAYDDDYVVNFLSKKAEKYQLENPKNTPSLIRDNLEDGILRTNFQALKDYDLVGNFGMHQEAAAITAVVFDSMPETQQIIEWLYADGAETASAAGPNPGGNVYRQLFSLVDRDGNGNEAAPGYNSGWNMRLIQIGDMLDGYAGADEKADLYKNPRVIKMLKGQIPLTLVGRTTAQIGDAGNLTQDTFVNNAATMLRAFQKTGDPEFAQFVYRLNGDTAKGLHYDIYTQNAGKAEQDVADVIDQYGEYPFNESDMLAGYGFSILRGGNRYESVMADNVRDTQRDFWLYFGFSGGKGNRHSHGDTLNLGMEAFGISVAPEIGYPQGWAYTVTSRPVLMHNTVQVNGQHQDGIDMTNGNPAYPKLFDDSETVKVMDVEASGAYAATSQYRRTVVSVDATSDISYGVDFFRVTGGHEHTYAFHALSTEIGETEGVTLNARGGTYAGEDVAYGSDVGTTYNESAYLTDIREDTSIQNDVVAVDFLIDDFRKQLDVPKDLHLRLTMLDATDLTDFTLAKAQPPQLSGNPEWLEYALARRKGGSNLDTLFTAVLEPYESERYIESIEQAPVTDAGGQAVDKYAVCAVKVTLTNGREDYIVRAADNTAVYRIDDLFDFRGAVGVYMVKDGENVYSYVNDGDQIGDMRGTAALTGQVQNFTQELSSENVIQVSLDTEVELERLNGKWIYVNNDGRVNAAYPIRSAKRLENGFVELNVGDITLIRSIKSRNGLDLTFNYNIAAGQTFRIPLPNVEDSAPVFEPVKPLRITAGSKLSQNIRVTSAAGRDITLNGLNLPRGAMLQGDTLIWTPDNNQIGPNVATVQATDGIFTVTLDIPITVAKKSASSPSDPGNSNDPGKTEDPDKPVTPVDPIDPVDPVDPESRFIDLGGYDWAAEAINGLSEKEIIKGTGPNTFSPGRQISRADFAILLVRAFELKDAPAENFADVTPDDYFAAELAVAKAAGIGQGIGNNRFNPRGEITRQDMMVMLARAMDAQGRALSEADAGALSEFADGAQVAAYARDAVARLVADGVIAGDNGRIRPLDHATRAETAVMLGRIFLTD